MGDIPLLLPGWRYDPLETIKKIVPWEDFRADIEAATETKPEERKSNAGIPEAMKPGAIRSQVPVSFWRSSRPRSLSPKSLLKRLAWMCRPTCSALLQPLPRQRTVGILPI
jgi:hypothetical protein